MEFLTSFSLFVFLQKNVLIFITTGKNCTIEHFIRVMKLAQEVEITQHYSIDVESLYIQAGTPLNGAC